MSALAPTRVGWCPGALAPMASGDGLIVRVKPRGGRLTPKQAAAIGLASETWGSGELELTTRANLQIRGLREESLADLVKALDLVGLIDPSPAGEAARNVISSPLAGFDPAALFDIRPAVGALETWLAGDASLHALPAKFSVVVDDGGRLGLSDVAADIRFEAVLNDAGPVFAVRLGGAEDEAAGRCRPENLADTAAALVHVFLAGREPDDDMRRMRHLVSSLGAATVLRRAGLDLWEPPVREKGSSDFVGVQSIRRSATPSPRERGEGDAQHLSDRDAFETKSGEAYAFLGVAARFGRLSADQLQLLAGKTDQSGAAELRLTAWRAILVPGLRAEAASVLAESCALAGFILDPADPRLRVAACTGAPGCHRGTTPVLAHAARLSARLEPNEPGRGILVHVSGCSKGCAHAGKAPLTLVADNGRYNVVVDGSASDRPILHSLSFEEAAACLKALPQMERRA